MSDKEIYLEDEILIVRNSGEIPEITFHSSLYFLTEDPEGPGIRLNDGDVERLRTQAFKRYREIILRDLTPENRDKSIYRGVKRTIFNWQRLGKFCRRQRVDLREQIRAEVAEALKTFLRQEATEVAGGRRKSCVNCPAQELEAFAAELGVSPHDLPDDWQHLCSRKG